MKYINPPIATNLFFLFFLLGKTAEFAAVVQRCGLPYFAFDDVKCDANVALASGEGSPKLKTWSTLSDVQVRGVLSRLRFDCLFKEALPSIFGQVSILTHTYIYIYIYMIYIPNFFLLTGSTGVD